MDLRKVDYAQTAETRRSLTLPHIMGSGIAVTKLFKRDADLEDFERGMELSERIWGVEAAAKSS
jgi:hypothetical protein